MCIRGSLAPDRVQWGRDNKGAMIRALMAPGDRASRIENRVAEPAANPYLFFASQILCGLDGVTSGLSAPAPVENPYTSDARAPVPYTHLTLPTILPVHLSALSPPSITLYTTELRHHSHSTRRPYRA